MKQLSQPCQRWSALATGLLLLGALVLTACQPIQPVATSASPVASSAVLPQIMIKAQDFAFDLPAELPSGLVSLTLTNAGKANHHAIVSRLKAGVTLAQLKAVLQNPQGNPADVSDLSFFMPDTNPGTSNQATVTLAPGNWVVFSVSRSDVKDPTPDWARGSIQPFHVTNTPTTAAPPQADLVLTIGQADADMPATLGVGQHTIQVVKGNDAAAGWAFFIKLEGDSTINDLRTMFDAFFAGQQPTKMADFHPVGGLMGYNLSDAFYTTIDFTPGNYAVITSIQASDFPYSGLDKTFTVK